jgi:hypothetical protein
VSSVGGLNFQRYASGMKSLRRLLKRLPGGHRPPTGPLTTSEANAAEDLRQETKVKDDERIKREQQNSSSA